MISLEEAQARLLGDAAPLPPETLGILDACGRFLATDIHARLTQPPVAVSAMDGYAVRDADGAGPWTVIGESAAGAGFRGRIGAGQAVRIFTGAPMPEGGDTVVLQEDVVRDGDRLRLAPDEAVTAGSNVRALGLDFAAGERVAEAGARITPALCGLLTAAGHATVRVPRRPKVVLIATGSELVPPGATPGPNQIVSSNGIVLAALFAEAGAEVVDLGIVKDDLDALSGAIDSAQGADLIVTIGGASVGDHDLVAPALRQVGATIDFWKVAIRPGKPVLTGWLGASRVLGLPGNPVSAYVCALLFGAPLVRALAGHPRPLPQVTTAATAVALPANGPRRDFMRASVEGGIVTPARRQDSSMLSVLASSNALLVRPPQAPPVARGEQVEIIALDSDCYAS